MFGSVEGLTGILMGGFSTGLFFGIASRLFARREKGPGQ